MPHVASYILLAHDAEQRLIESLDMIGRAHVEDSEVLHGTRTLAEMSRQQLEALEPVRAEFADKREDHKHHEPTDFFTEPYVEARKGSLGLVRDLQDLLMLAAFVESVWLVVFQGAKAMKHEQLKAICEQGLHHNEMQERWLRTHLKTAAPQALMLAQ